MHNKSYNKIKFQGNKMNKAEFIDAVASKSGLTKKDSKAALEAVLETITETLSRKEQVALIGFGTFSTSERAARTATVPGTTKTVQVAATTAIKFKVGKLLKQAVAGK
jgi:DNA-binding protein HU-beta